MLEAQGYIAISVIYLVVAWVHWRFSNKADVATGQSTANELNEQGARE
ncbi:hypothetical protein [Bradyrhizobium genosp. P]